MERLRRISQILFLIFFLYLFFHATYPYEGGIPAEIFLQMSPLVAVVTMIATRVFLVSLLLGLIVLALSFFLGRYFCGWMCPQTIFMEMVFRKVEYLIEGDRTKQIKLDKQKWNGEKIAKKSLKWSIFAIISFLIANAFLAYFIGGDVLIQHVLDGPMEHYKTFINLLVFTMVFFFVFAWFREQVCIIACPYGRLQGVLLDDKSIIVAYDHERGEKRQKLRKTEDREAQG